MHNDLLICNLICNLTFKLIVILENGKIKNQGCYDDIVEEFPQMAKQNERFNFGTLIF